MSRSNDRAAGGLRSVVSPPPSLSTNGARHRSNGNYNKSYGRSSFEQQQLHQKAKHPLQPTQQETLQRMNSKPTVRSDGHRLVPPPGIVATVTADAVHATVSENSDVREGCDEVDVSPLTTPAQSCLPENRRRNDHPTNASVPPASQASVAVHSAAAATAFSVAPRLAVTGKQREMNANKENTNVSISTGSAPVTASVAPPVVVVAHNRSTLNPSANRALGTPTVLYRRTPSSNGRQTAGNGGHGTTYSAAAGITASAQRGAVSKSAMSLKVRPRKVASACVPAAATAASFRTDEDKPDCATTKENTTQLPSSPKPIAAAIEAKESAKPQPPRASSPEVDWALQVQLDQAKSVLAYVAEVSQALAERRRCGPPPDSTEDFRASVIPCRRVANRAKHHDAHYGDRNGGGSDDGDQHNYSANKHHDVTDDEDDTRSANRVDTVALLPDLHRAASCLLSTFTKLEYAQLSEDVDLPLLEREVLEHSALLRRLVDGVDRQLSLHERAEVRHLRSDCRGVFIQAHCLVDFVARTAQQVVLLRGMAAHHDLAEAREVWEGFKKSVEAQDANQQQQEQQLHERASGSEGASKSNIAAPSTRVFSAMLMLRASPFFQWLETRWFPAMQEWQQLVLKARQLARTGDTDAAIRRSRQDALQIVGLQEILRPGETISGLHHAQVVVPVTELGKTFVQKRAVMDQLRKIMNDRGNLRGSAALSKALKAAQAYSHIHSGRLSGSNNSDASTDNDDADLMKEAEDLLQRIQDVERLRGAVAAALQISSPEITVLLEHITRANELILLWHLPYDEASARAAIAAGRSALEHGKGGAPAIIPSPSSVSPHFSLPSGRTSNDSSPLHGGGVNGVNAAPEVPPLNLDTLSGNGNSNTPPPPPPASLNSTITWIGGGFPSGFDVHALHVPHTTASAWPSDFDLLYRELCDVFTMLFLRRQAQRQLELALGRTPEDRMGARLSNNIHQLQGSNVGYRTPSPQVTPHRFTCDDASLDATQRSSENGSTTPTAARSSGANSQRNSKSHHQTAASAEELRRRIRQAEEAGISGALVDEARARLRRLLTVRLKIHFDAQTRVLPVADAAEAKFTEVYEQVHAHCQTQLAQSSSAGNNNKNGNNGGSNTPSPWADRRLRIRYEDADGDFISLLNQQDWDVMLSELLPDESSNGGTGGKIDLFCDYPLLLNVPPSPQQRQQGNENGSNVGVCGTDFQTNDNEGGDAAAAGGATTTTPEKQPNVFERLTSAKDTTPNTHGGRGVGTTANCTSRGRARNGGGPATASSAQHALIHRSRNAAVAAGSGAARQASGPVMGRPGVDGAQVAAQQRRGLHESPSASSTGNKSTAANTSNSPAELTADNLRRNIFLASPSPPSTEGRRSGGDNAADSDACRSSGGEASAMAAAITRKKLKKSNSTGDVEREEGSNGNTVARAVHMGAEAVNNTADNQSTKQVDESTLLVAKENPFESEMPSSVVHVNIGAARRWDATSEDDFQLLEIQTRASVSTVRMDSCLSASSFDALPPSRCMVASTTQLGPSVGRNTFTTSRCSGKAVGNTKAVSSSVGAAPATEGEAIENGRFEETKPGAPLTAPLNNMGVPPARLREAKGESKKATTEEQKKSTCITQSPTRHTPRRWTSDDFSLEEVKTVCSDRSRVAMLPVVPRGPTTLPPRPQTPSGTPNRTPQRVRRGARGTPTGGRPDGDGSGEGEFTITPGDSAEDLFAEMQRMRDENTRAMTQPRKAAWH